MFHVVIFYKSFIYFSACPKQKYKNVIGNHPCQACPAYSRATNSGSTICECSNHYYRAENDESTKECTSELQLDIEHIVVIFLMSGKVLWTIGKHFYA